MSRFRTLLFSGIAVVTLTASPQAHAAIVFDPSAFGQMITSLINDAKMIAHDIKEEFHWVGETSQWVKEQAQWVKENTYWIADIAWAKQQWETLVVTYNALTNITDLWSASYALGGLTRNYFPEAEIIPQLLGDSAYLWGHSGEWYSNDLYYASTMSDKWAAEMDRRMVATSNTKGIIESSSMNAQDHLTRLEYLRNELHAAPDISSVERIRGLIDLEGQNLEVHKAQTENVAVLLAANQQVTDMRAEQVKRESAEMLMATTSPITDTLK